MVAMTGCVRRARGRTVLVVAALVVASVASVLPSATAGASGGRAAILFPFGGKTWLSGDGPGVHHRFWNAWAEDLHAPVGTAVKARFASSDGAITLSIASIGPTCAAPNSAGSNVTVNVYVDGTHVGEVIYGHLANVQVAAGQSIVDNTTLGYLHNWTWSSCWQDNTSDGVVHTHIEVEKGCYRTLAAWTNHAETTPIGLLKSSYGSGNLSTCDENEVNQVISGTGTPPPPPPPPDQDGDGVPDSSDFCLWVHGASGLNGCPESRRVDVNGDGKTDRLLIWNGGVDTWLSNGDGTYALAAQGYVPVAGYNMAGGFQWETADANGDGKTDLLHLWSGGVNVWFSNGDGTYAFNGTYKPSPSYTMTGCMAWVTGSFDGDGKADLACMWNQGVDTWLSNGDGTYDLAGQGYLPLPGYSMTGGFQWLTGDANDDGRTDLYHLWSGGVNVWFSNGDGTYTFLQTYKPFPEYSMTSGFYWKAGDADGDGKTDLLHMWSGGVNTWLSNGNGSFTASAPFVPFPGYGMTGGTWQFGDANGDARLDLFHIWSGGVNTWLSNGDGTYAVTNPFKPFTEYSMTSGLRFMIGDHAGNGRDGLVHIWSGGVNTWLSNGDGSYDVTEPYVPLPGYNTAGGTWY